MNAARLAKIMRVLEMSEDAVMAELENAVFDGPCLAVCPDFCETDPDGVCEHGRPSILLAMGLI